MSVTVSKLSSAVGAEIQGVDLSNPLSDEDFAAIHRAWLDHSVLVFRGQNLTEEMQSAFAFRFGNAGVVRSRPGERRTNSPHVMFIGNVKVPGHRNELPEGEMQFHSDQCYYEVPSKATLLYAVEVPKQGGDTLFASAYRAYDVLPEATKTKIENLSCLFLYDYENNANARGQAIDPNAPRYIHPVVIVHPETGRKALYVNRLMSDHVVELPPEESRALLEELYTVLEDPTYVYAHKWQPGDLVMWDNRCVLHARTDFDPRERRILRRMTVAGTKPMSVAEARERRLLAA